MKALNQIKAIVTLLLLVCSLLFAPGSASKYSIRGVRASVIAIADSANQGARAPDREPQEITPKEEAGGEDEGVPDSDPPGTADQNNSNGDDVIIRIIR